MSSTDTRWAWDFAKQQADDLVSLLESACHSITIAGSIRRLKPEIGDIDLVCVPVIEREAGGLFGDELSERDLLHDRCTHLVADGVLQKRLDKNGRQSWGASLKRATFRGLNVDIQVVADLTTLGAWILIRTGPAEFNKAVVTPTYQGGLLPSGFKWQDGFQLYRYGGRVETPNEQSVFDALGIPFVEPSQRSAAPRPGTAAADGGSHDE